MNWIKILRDLLPLVLELLRRFRDLETQQQDRIITSVEQIRSTLDEADAGAK